VSFCGARKQISQNAQRRDEVTRDEISLTWCDLKAPKSVR